MGLWNLNIDKKEYNIVHAANVQEISNRWFYYLLILTAVNSDDLLNTKT